MLHFFRKIRRDLLTNNQFFKYLKYAIGEIILVVLGILIALYINNQNEERKEQEKFDEVLVEIENELIWNTQNALSGIQFLIGKDSLCSLFLVDGLTREQLEKDSLLQFRYYFGDYSFIVEDKAFNRIMDIENGLTDKQDSIRRILTNLYNKDSIGLSKLINNHSNELEKTIHKSIRKHNWYKDFMLLKPYTENEIDYYINDPDHQKNVIEYKTTTLSGHYFQLQYWFQKFLKSYTTVYTYLERRNIQHNDSLHFSYNPKEYAHFIGRYKLVEFSIPESWIPEGDHIEEVESINGKFYANSYLNDSLTDRFEIYPVSTTCYIPLKHFYNGFSRIRFNEQNKVSGSEKIIGTIRFETELISLPQ